MAVKRHKQRQQFKKGNTLQNSNKTEKQQNMPFM